MTSRERITEAAEEFARSGRFREAIAEYQKLLDGNAVDVPIGNIIGDLHLRIGQRDKALNVFLANLAVLDRRGAFAQALALAKKIHKLDPGNGEILARMGDLYGRLGFAAEARAEFLEAAAAYEDRGDVPGRISMYEKLAGLDRTDFDSRFKLARLLAAENRTERAVAEFNAVAEIQLARGDAGGAEKTLREALVLGESDVRTVIGLARLYSGKGRRADAIAVLESSLAAAPRPEFMVLLGDLWADAGHVPKARESYERLLAQDPEHFEARFKLGRLEVKAGRPDQAFALFEPLITDAIHKGHDERAIGLLGLILMFGTVHLPSLEKLAHVYRLSGQRANLEVADRVLLREFRREGKDAERAAVLAELTELCPRDRAVTEERRRLGADPATSAGVAAVVRPMSAPSLGEADRDLIRANLAKIDLYIGQGLVRNARRLLEDLRLLYPGEPRIEGRLAALRDREKGADNVDIPVMIKRILTMESTLAGELSDEPRPAPPPPVPAATPVKPSKTVRLEEIFGGTDLTSAAAGATGGKAADYPDLSGKIREEREAMERAVAAQLKAGPGSLEKGLAEIVSDFRKRVEQRIDHESRDVRYNLGLAFMEQGLLDEAVEEFKLAARDETLALDSLSLLSQCFRRKKNYAESLRWVEKAMILAPEGSLSQLALIYDLASLREDMNQKAAALELYRKVRERAPRYRDAALRIKILEKSLG
jgi:tetratricopeptide (TPR) repeat protein